MMFIEPVGGGGGSVHWFHYLLLFRMIYVYSDNIYCGSYILYCYVHTLSWAGIVKANPGNPAESHENNGYIIRVGVYTGGMMGSIIQTHPSHLTIPILGQQFVGGGYIGRC
jgi:hypothetical protein